MAIRMKRRILFVLALAMLSGAGCDLLGLGDEPSGGSDTPGGNNGTEQPQQPQEPLFPPGSETVEGVKQPKGAVKTWNEMLYYAGKMTMKFERTYIYDALGRPARADVISHSYDDNGNEVGSPTRRSDHFFFLDDGTYEERNREAANSAYLKATLNKQGLISHIDNGYYSGGNWISTQSSDIEYTNTYYRSAITNPTGTAAFDKVPWTYSWSNDGNLYSAVECWPTGKEPDVDDIKTEYYFYTDELNPTLGAVFDITAQIIQGMQGFYVYGRGTKNLPSYINTMYRNKQRSFTYKWSSDRKFITEITIERWPFANDSDLSSLKYTHTWLFTYYQ